ncbi:MAG: 16S rRNA (cytidine(1402)-2'-O)-methyltransferase [Deltaproteobacteria bacterium GWC2_42_11]|nr:MAG: 16S rRNA (cytidine(1402)-2'-O)-methyltransferase [Deltaproteobacteria bacterium GWC2_42_11]HBO84447.1 16S rRNA (cytidine(1402)-2'-O)-methyltransferase [Deltaproteobacteria bacterium]
MGKLYIVATPIGNLEDITLRAIRVLKEVDLIAAEDTRHTRKLLNHYNIKTPLTSYFEHNEVTKSKLIISEIRNGKDVALVSDAGTPGISDPGYRLVKLAVENSIDVVPVPGPSAVISTLCASGLPTDSFVFEGFLPAAKGEADKLLLAVKGEKRTLIFFESPRRIVRTLETLLKIYGDTDIVIAREVSKLHEEFLRGKVSTILENMKLRRDIKGEVTVIIAPVTEGYKTDTSIEDDIIYYHKNLGLPLKEVVSMIAKERGLQKREVYRKSIEIKKEEIQ